MTGFWRNPRFWLTLAAAGGIALAGFGLLETPPPPPPQAAAIVNERVIPSAVYDAALASFAASRRSIMSDADKRHVLNRLIDEELLFQKAGEIELAASDRLLRASIVQAMIALILQNNIAEPDERQLADFYDDNRQIFARKPLFNLAHLYLAPAHTARAERVSEFLANNGAFAEAKARFADPQPAPLPQALLPQTSLSYYLGAALAARAATMKPGEIIGPVVQEDGTHFLFLNASSPSQIPPFAEIRDEVAARWRRQQDDMYLRRELDRLRRQAQVHINDR